MQQSKRQNHERGNVVIFILIAVFLFGALAYTFTRSARDGTNNISRQQAKIAAQEILNYARLVEGAVNRVRRSGCSENEINFTNPLITHPTYWGAYSNSNSPSDNSCHIFEPEGGKIGYIKNPPGVLEDITGYGIYSFTGRPAVEDIGPGDAGELLMVVIMDDIENNRVICQAINDALDVGEIETDTFNAGTNVNRFTGGYTNTTTDGNRLTTTNLTGKYTGCLRIGGWGNRYFFYHVLLPR